MTKKHSYFGCRNENCDAIACVDRRTYQSIIKNDTAHLVELKNKLIISESARMVERGALLKIATDHPYDNNTENPKWVSRNSMKRLRTAARKALSQPEPGLASVIGKLVGALEWITKQNTDQPYLALKSDVEAILKQAKHALDSVRGELEKIGVRV